MYIVPNKPSSNPGSLKKYTAGGQTQPEADSVDIVTKTHGVPHESQSPDGISPTQPKTSRLAT